MQKDEKKQIDCPLCTSKYATWNGLKYHMFRVHKDEQLNEFAVMYKCKKSRYCTFPKQVYRKVSV